MKEPGGKSKAMNRVIIIGAGAQANVLCGLLAQAEDVDEIVLTDINPDRIGEIAETNGSDKIKSKILNASDD